MKLKVILLALAFTSVGCADNNSNEVVTDNTQIEMKESSNENQGVKEASARYTLTFTSLWTKADHIFDLPGSAHFSPLVVTVHNDAHTLVRMGDFAGAGLELVSELGRTGVIENELSAAVRNGAILNSTITENQFIRNQLTQTITLEVSAESSMVSLVSMIAPSPDWIVALDSLNLHNGSEFLEDSGDIMLFAYNAGTENGDQAGNFSINNSATSPQAPISMLTGRGFDKPFAKLRLEKIN